MTGRRLHILEVGLRWPPETFLQWRLTGLAARGHEVTVASATGGRDSRAELPGVRRMRIPHWQEPRWRKLAGAVIDGLRLLASEPARLRLLARGVWRSLPPERRRLGDLMGGLRLCLPLARARPDVVHFEWETTAIAYRPLFDVWDCPIVVSCHGGAINRHPHVPAMRPRLLRGFPVVFDRAAVVHCVCRAVATEAGRYGLDADKVRVIRTSVDGEFWTPGIRNGDGGPLRLVGVSRMIWSKGHVYALLALRRLVDEGVPVVYEIVGGTSPGSIEPSEEAHIEYTLDDLGLRDHVRLHGNVPSERVREVLRRSDVFLHTSLSDGLPTVVVEGMACGLPVVATDVGGTGEAVRHEVDGLLVPPRSPEATAAAVRRLHDDPALRARMGRSGRERALSEFRLDTLLDSFEDLYGELAR